MLVRDLMTSEVATLKADETLDLAGDIMRLGRIRHMPVVSGERLVGILSQRDLFRAAISSALGMAPSAEREWLGRVAVREVMSTPVITARPDMPIRDAVELMIQHQIGCLPVVEGDQLVGLLSESDCLRFLVRVLGISEIKGRLPELLPD